MDLRKKACTNENCKSYKLKKYSPNINYCPECGTKLIFVCSNHNCFKPLDMSEPKHHICAECQAKKDDQMAKIKEIGAAGVAGVGVVVGKAFRKEILAGAKNAGKVVGGKVASVGVEAVKRVIH